MPFRRPNFGRLFAAFTPRAALQPVQPAADCIRGLNSRFETGDEDTRRNAVDELVGIAALWPALRPEIIKSFKDKLTSAPQPRGLKIAAVRGLGMTGEKCRSEAQNILDYLYDYESEDEKIALPFTGAVSKIWLAHPKIIPAQTERFKKLLTSDNDRTCRLSLMIINFVAGANVDLVRHLTEDIRALSTAPRKSDGSARDPAIAATAIMVLRKINPPPRISHGKGAIKLRLTNDKPATFDHS